MLLRMLLTLSVVAQSLPALACIRPGPEIDLKTLTERVPAVLPATHGGGTWQDSEGREGEFTSALVMIPSGVIARIGYSEVPYRYHVQFDNGKTMQFQWTMGSGSRRGSPPVFGGASVSVSGDGETAQFYSVEAKRVSSQNEEGRTITFVDHQGTKLTLVEKEANERMPNHITVPTQTRVELLNKRISIPRY